MNYINLTKTLRIIIDIVSKGKSVNNNKIHFKISGKETTNQSTISNALNNFFVQVG